MLAPAELPASSCAHTRHNTHASLPLCSILLPQQDPEFKLSAARRWQALRNSTLSNAWFSARIDSAAGAIYPDAIMRNYAKWVPAACSWLCARRLSPPWRPARLTALYLSLPPPPRRWREVLRVPGDGYTSDAAHFEGNVKQLTTWLALRLGWLDQQFAEVAAGGGLEVVAPPNVSDAVPLTSIFGRIMGAWAG